jgi:hypothetical protein
MKSNLSRCVARLPHSLLRRPAPRAAARPRFRPVLECLEDRAVPSTLTVTNLDDSGNGSLRFELAQAQNGDTIVFDDSLNGGTLTLTSGELQVSQSVTIQGPGSDLLTIDGNHGSRVLEVLPGADVSILGLTFTHGVANSDGSGSLAGAGGGIRVDGGAALTLTGSVVTGNTANAASATDAQPNLVSGTGGGIWNAGTLTLIDDVISGNTANTGSALDVIGARVNSSGGGLFNVGTLTASATTVANNTSNAGASSFLTDAEAGGIYTSGTLSLNGVVVSGNIANAGPVTASQTGRTSGAGGGLFINAGTATVTDSFFLDNAANTASASADPQSGLVDVRGEGGGVYNQGGLTVITTAFSGNVANSGSATGGGVATVTGYGGAIHNHGGQLTATGLGVTDNIANAGSGRTAARGLGGGIYGSGRISVDSSLVDGNTANAGSATDAIEAQGGGIYDQSALVLTGSSVTNNTVNSGSAAVLRASGGGLWIAGGTITDSTVSFNIVNSGSGIPLLYLSGGGIYDSGRLTVTNTFDTFNNMNTDPTSGTGLGGNPSIETGGGIEVAGASAFVTLNYSTVAANYALDVVTNIHLSAGGQVDPDSSNNFIGTGGSGGLVNGVNGNVVLGP